MNNGSGEEEVGMEAFREKVTQDIGELKTSHNRMSDETSKIKDDIRDLQTTEKLQDLEITGIKSSLSQIKDDTNWIRRRITGAVITATITAAIGGLIAIAVAVVYG